MRFGRLTVLAEIKEERRTLWRCKCDCGQTKMLLPYNVKSGHTMSCGCLKIIVPSVFNATHGQAGSARTKEYTVWSSMHQRCFDKKCQAYKNYGGRGIRICARWLRFENFFADMGKLPADNYSIERIDNDGNYE